jgi:hypothetical protein
MIITLSMVYDEERAEASTSALSTIFSEGPAS